jgi:triosephosphate isomerase
VIQAAIRTTLASLFGDAIADGVRILYGGSVTADNARSFFSQPGIDGALVGGASLRSEAFIGIAEAAG